VLDDFSKAERAGWVATTIAAIADTLPVLLAGDDPGFMTRVAFLAPPPPSPPRES